MLKREQTRAIARAIRSTQSEANNLNGYSRKGYNKALEAIANRLATICELESARFNREVFFKECGLEFDAEKLKRMAQ